MQKRASRKKGNTSHVRALPKNVVRFQKQKSYGISVDSLIVSLAKGILIQTDGKQ